MYKDFPELAVFDLDNTLYNYRVCHSAALSKVEEAFYLMTPSNRISFEKAYLLARQRVKQRVEGFASHSRTLYFSELLSSVGFRLDQKSLLDLVSIYWSTFFENLQPAKGIETLLRNLRLGGSTLCLVTNFGTEIQYQKLLVLNLLEMFDVIVTSEEAGGEKKTFKPFNLMLERLQKSDLSSAWFFGDDVDDFPTSFPASTCQFFGSPFMKRRQKGIQKIPSFDFFRPGIFPAR